MKFDPIADMLTRIRNAITAKKEDVVIPSSKLKMSIANILLAEGYISQVEETSEGVKKNIKVTLKYGPNGEKVIQGIKRISKPGLRIFSNAEDLPKVINGLGIAIISTNKGVMTDKQARSQNLGGEVLAYVW
ncbi:MAG: 30S ribosomal protein S8 [Clostridiales bacterium]|nr:30S ribosomal protein S8 [Clostridiales bacterium]